jgi:hypothetical protein
MRVGQRLFLAVLPAVLGVLAMAGLAWWGQRGRQVPAWLLVAGLLAAAASLVMAWRGTRYVARGIEALSGGRAEPAASTGPADELDAIRLRIAEAERRGESREAAAEALVRESAALLADAAATVGRRLEAVRMPLHILLSSPFGPLNENQEEMIGAAHSAAEDADGALRRVGRVVELDAGRVEFRLASVRPHGLIEPLLAALEGRLREAGATLETDLPPLLPLVRVDARHAREALSLVLDGVAEGAAPGAAFRVRCDARDGFVRLRVQGGAPDADETFPLARRLLLPQGGAVAADADGSVEVRLALA